MDSFRQTEPDVECVLMYLLAKVLGFLERSSVENLILPVEEPVGRGRGPVLPPTNAPDVETHRHSCFEVILCTNGTARYFLAGKRLLLKRGHIVLIPPEVRHAYIQGGTFTHLWLILDRTRGSVHELISRGGRYRAGKMLRTVVPEFHLELMSSGLAVKSPQAHRLHLFGALLELVAQIEEASRRLPERTRMMLPEELLAEILEYLRRNYARPLSLGELSEMARLSPAYFSTIFKSQVGSSFKDYLTALRMKTARELLRQTNRSVKEISALVGYEDPFYFSRAFSRVVGRPPSDYRRALVLRRP